MALLTSTDYSTDGRTDMLLTMEVTSEAETRPVAYVEVFTILTIGVMCIVGNSLVLVAIATNKKLRTSSNTFVCNLSISDGVVGLMLIFTPINILSDSNQWGSAACNLWGFMAVVCVVTSLFSLASISINRYYLIAHAQSYKRVFSKGKCLLMSAFIWLIGLSFASPTVTGWSDIRFNPNTNVCSYSRDASSSYHYFLLGGAFFIPLTLCIVSYTRLFLEVRKSSLKIRAGPGNAGVIKDDPKQGNGSGPNRSRQQKDIKLTRTLFAIFLVYLICGGPYAIVNALDSDGQRFGHTVHVLISWIGFTNSAVNPILYGFLNKQYRDGYVVILNRFCACVRRQEVAYEMDGTSVGEGVTSKRTIVQVAPVRKA